MYLIISILVIIIGLIIGYQMMVSQLMGRSKNYPNVSAIAPNKKILVCAGDSISRGNLSYDWVNDLNTQLTDYQIFNAGVNADLSYTLLNRLDDIIAVKPNHIVTIATFFIQKDTTLYYFSYLCVMKAKEVLKKYSISRNTLHHWVKRGKISYERTPTGQYDYFPVEEPLAVVSERTTVVYARVSTSAQQENLNRQIERLKAFCSARGYILDTLYFDIGSALNSNRKKYAKLYQAIVEKKVGKLIIEYQDRLLRFGFEDFERLCALLGTELIVLDHTKGSKSSEKEMTEDLISIIHHFSMRLYSSRRGKKVLSDIETILNENNQTSDVDSQIET